MVQAGFGVVNAFSLCEKEALPTGRIAWFGGDLPDRLDAPGLQPGAGLVPGAGLM